MKYTDKSFKITIPYAPTARLIIFKLYCHENMIIIDTHYPDKLKDTFYFRDEDHQELTRTAVNELIKCCARWAIKLEYNSGLYKNELLAYLKINLK